MSGADHRQLLANGYGHVGRVGYLSPGIVDETLSAQFYRMAPPGVTMVRTSLELKDVTVAEVNNALARTETASKVLGKYKPDCICFGGSPTVAVPGHGSDKTIVEQIEKASGCKAFSAQAAAIEALQRHGAKRLALATPFPDDVNALVKVFLEKSGFEILSIRGLGVHYTQLTVAPQPCVDNIEGLERELGTFVISSLQASMWKALSIIGYKTPVPGYGKLLRDL